MSNRFRIELEWLARESGGPIDRATLAELTIAVGSQVATEVEDILARTVRQGVRLSALDLAHWIASNWWRLRWEPKGNSLPWKLSHKLGAVGGGYMWPDLTFVSDGETVLVRSRSTPVVETQPVRYPRSFDEVLPAHAFEQGVDAFVDAVTARLAGARLNDSELGDLWALVREERGDPGQCAWRRLEAMLGYDPDEAPVGLLERLSGMTGRYGASAISELAAASNDKAPDDLDRLWNDVRPNAVAAQMTNVTDLRRKIRDRTSGMPLPWLRAVRAATIARASWALGPGPVSTGDLSGLLKIPEHVIREGEEPAPGQFSAAFRNNKPAGMSVFLNKKHPTARRFALARLIGDHLNAPSGERLLPATDARTARQKFQRAFAQEFLCPFSDLQAYLGADEPTDEGIEAAAEHFDVSPLAIRTALVNKGLMGRENIGA